MRNVYSFSEVNDIFVDGEYYLTEIEGKVHLDPNTGNIDWHEVTKAQSFLDDMVPVNMDSDLGKKIRLEVAKMEFEPTHEPGWIGGLGD